MHKFIPLILSCSAYAAQTCSPTSPVPCNRDTCEPTFCLGPATTQANAPVRPYTCDGDFVVTASALYWKAQQDGLEYGFFTNTTPTLYGSTPPVQRATLPMIDAYYLAPKPSWDLGFKIGIAYASPCDGWDLELNWISFNSKARSTPQNHEGSVTLNTFWSSLMTTIVGELRSNEIIAEWRLKLDEVNFNFGRDFWVSKRLSLRSFLGIEYLVLDQDYNLTFLGGSLQSYDGDYYSDTTQINQNFHGVGPFAGMANRWHFGCGWNIYGNISAGIVYGKFHIDHDENIREVVSPFAKTKILETKDSFHASRALLNMALGLEYTALICNCKYGLTARLGWEQNLFFHQNQMWRVVRNMGLDEHFVIPGITGENVFTQSRGNLSIGGLTLKVAFAF